MFSILFRSVRSGARDPQRSGTQRGRDKGRDDRRQHRINPKRNGARAARSRDAYVYRVNAAHDLSRM
jgi:hypothetical protein